MSKFEIYDDPNPCNDKIGICSNCNKDFLLIAIETDSEVIGWIGICQNCNLKTIIKNRCFD